MLRLLHSLRRSVLREDGAASVEFVVVFPFFVGVFLSAFDVAMMNYRAVMLERATDMVVRDIRLASGATQNYDDIVDNICAEASMIPDCTDTIMVELQPMDTANWTGMQNRAQCVNRNAAVQPAASFRNGAQNELMLIRVCAVVDPLFPGIGVGRSMPKDPSGGYQIIASSAFVNEP